MIDDDLSGLPRSALRDYAGDPRIDRVWDRLEADLAPRAPRTRLSLLLVPAFGVTVFVAGVLVGRVTAPALEAEQQVVAERPAMPERTANAGLPAPGSYERPSAPVPSSRPRPTAPHRAQAVNTSVGADAPLAEAEVESAPSPPLAAAAPPQQPEWLKLAEVGDFAGARSALDNDGGFEMALAQSQPEHLLVLVDVARASGGREQAVRALRRLLEQFPAAPEAPLAAWTLANMLEQSGDAAGAAEAFTLYRRLSPTGDFAEDAAARQVHVALSQGNAELAVQLLDQYEKDYPNGRRLSEFREELAKLEAERDAAGVVPTEPRAAEPIESAPSAPAPQH